MIIVNKPCQRCGETMLGVSSTKQFCDECQRIKEVERRARLNEEKRSWARAPKTCDICSGEIDLVNARTNLCKSCREDRYRSDVPRDGKPSKVKSVLPNGKSNPEYHKRRAAEKKRQSEYRSDGAHGSGYY